MFLPNPSLLGRGIQPWRSPSPPGRSSPIPRRWSPFLGRLSPLPNQNTIDKARGINLLRLLCSNPRPRNLGFQTPAAMSVLLPRPGVCLLMVYAHGCPGVPDIVAESSHRRNLLSFVRAGKTPSRSVSVGSAGARFHRISGWVGNRVLPFEFAGSRVAVKVKAGGWIEGSNQMANLRELEGENAPAVGVWIAGRVPVWLLLQMPPWKDRLLQEGRIWWLAVGLTWLPAKTRAARVRRTKHARVWGWARVLGHGPKPEVQNCQFQAGPSMPVKSPDKRSSESARVGKWAWVLGPKLILEPINVTV